MDEIIIEPEKIIKAYIGIKPYADAVLARMNEPGLHSKNITKCFLPAEEYFKAFCTFSSLFGCADNVTPKQMAESNAFKFESPIIANNFLVYIRNNSFSVAFPAYFHELGHIATSSFTKRKDVEKHSRLILAEMLADSFESWASRNLIIFQKISSLKTSFIFYAIGLSRKKMLKQQITDQMLQWNQTGVS